MVSVSTRSIACSEFFRISWVNRWRSPSEAQQNVITKLAHVHEQSEFTYDGYVLAAGRVNPADIRHRRLLLQTSSSSCEKDSEAVLGVWLPAPADAASAACSRRALAVGRWRGDRFGR